MQLSVFVCHREEGLVMPVVDVRNPDRTVEDAARLCPLIVNTGRYRNFMIVLIGIRIHVGVAEDIVCGAVIRI